MRRRNEDTKKELPVDERIRPWTHEGTDADRSNHHAVSPWEVTVERIPYQPATPSRRILIEQATNRRTIERWMLASSTNLTRNRQESSCGGTVAR